FTYLLNAISSSKDKWTQLFVLIALKKMRLNENEMSEVKAKLLEINNQYEYPSNSKSIYDILESADAPTLVGLQVYLTAQSHTADSTQLPESEAVLQVPEFSRH